MCFPVLAKSGEARKRSRSRKVGKDGDAEGSVDDMYSR